MNITPDRRQFTVSREPWPAPPDWGSVELPHGYTLQHHPQLHITRNPAPAALRLTLGHAFETPGHGVAGRFVTIEGSFLRPDAAGLLALLYRKDAQGITVTSSPAIACRAYGATACGRPLPRHGLNWHPSPGSPVKGWARLLADQCIDLASGHVITEPKAIVTDLAEEQAAEKLLAGLVELVRLVHDRFARTLLPLTAGLDSRTLFAALRASGVAFETFTQVFDDRSRQDAQTAHMLARRHGVTHHIVPALAPREEYRELLHRHQLDSVCDADTTVLFSGSFYRHLRSDDVFIRGGLFELGRCDYLGRMWGLRPGDPGRVATAILQRFGEAPAGPLLEAVRAWWAHRERHPLGVDIGDAFYFDQDIGAWMSSIEQGLDSLPATSIQPMNSLALMGYLLSTSPQRRRAGRVQRRVITRFDAALDRVPYNSFNALRQRLRGSPVEYAYYWLCSLSRS